MSKSSTILMIVSAILLVMVIVIGVYGYFVNYQYENKIGAYMDNAKDMNTPSRMIEQLQLAKQGMIDAGLTENDYGAMWFKKPDNSMTFQYQHLDSIIERARAVEEWRQKTYGNDSSTQTESLGDVYESKMTNLRNFIMETTRSDWIAKNAWYVKYYKVLYFEGEIILVLIALIIILIIVALSQLRSLKKR